MKNSNKIILDLCGGTGSWSKPYKDAGYDVRLVTLPDLDVQYITKGQNFLVFVGNKKGSMLIDLENIYGILAAPPCTEFSLAKGNSKRDFKKAMSVVRACLDVIWTCREYGKLKFWAMENPVGFLRQFMGKPAMTFQPWEFGAQTAKKTDLWGYFKEPRKKVKTKPSNLTTYIGKSKNGISWATPPIPKQYAELKLSRADRRAITPSEFSEAFFKANQ